VFRRRIGNDNVSHGFTKHVRTRYINLLN
jgi:hypothetical protein